MENKIEKNNIIFRKTRTAISLMATAYNGLGLRKSLSIKDSIASACESILKQYERDNNHFKSQLKK